MNAMTIIDSPCVARLHAFTPSSGTGRDEAHRMAVRELSASVRWLADGSIAIRYRLAADLWRVVIPQPRGGCAADGLWQHTCFEAFVATPGEAAYHEFNFSPSGQWAVYAFSAWRERDAGFVATTAPLLHIERSVQELGLEAVLPAALLPSGGAGGKLCIGLCAVIEHADGELEHWALHHPAPQPDFHHRGGFVLELAPPKAENTHD
ncbi:MAG: DOMON-like domain-containing protein [Gammaproteobacteria bacterium]|nr:DOMON-like domain-containing protein [Gammaproteobacteria bacterium]MBP6053516.1 DOMON-like domain-containing protein [Pseudomonadales bacterium]MBK6584625.1 DOMON-like domain-containing protein [Gammaproteobacteria bacterium]MBK7170927.1 DOMON-like domain-containing protein [Gammaproteobacteria bacterium]MBK7519866.1 DOMON-like domain-containing protein [Gammaproteobacteria bacterium]